MHHARTTPGRAAAVLIAIAMILTVPAPSVEASGPGSVPQVDPDWGYEVRYEPFDWLDVTFLQGMTSDRDDQGSPVSARLPIPFEAELYGERVAEMTSSISKWSNGFQALGISWGIGVAEWADIRFHLRGIVTHERHAWVAPGLVDGVPAVMAAATVRGVSDSADLLVIHVRDGPIRVYASGTCGGCDENPFSLEIHGPTNGIGFVLDPPGEYEWRCLGDETRDRCAMNAATRQVYDECGSTAATACVPEPCSTPDPVICDVGGCEPGEAIVPCATRTVADAVALACGPDPVVACALGVVDAAVRSACGEADPGACRTMIEDRVASACGGPTVDDCAAFASRAKDDLIEDVCGSPDAVGCTLAHADQAVDAATGTAGTVIAIACGDPDPSRCGDRADQAVDLAQAVGEDVITIVCGHGNALACADETARALWRVLCGTEDTSGCVP